MKAQAVEINIPPTATCTPSELNIYSRKYYKTYFKPLFNKIVGQKEVGKQERISLITHLVAQKYASESKETKQEVQSLKQKEVEKKVKALEGADDLTPEQYMMYVQHLERSDISFYISVSAQAGIGAVGLSFAKGLKQRSGWIISVYAAGPDVLLGRKTSKISIHIGVNEFGHSFCMAHPKHEKEIMDPFTAFVDSVFKDPSSCEKFIRQDAGEDHASTSNNVAGSGKNTNGVSKHVDENTNLTLEQNTLFPQLDKTNDQEFTWDEIFPDEFTPQFEEDSFALNQVPLNAGLNCESVDDLLAQFNQEGFWSGNNTGNESVFVQPQPDMSQSLEQPAAGKSASGFVQPDFNMLQSLEQPAVRASNAYNLFLPQASTYSPYEEFGILPSQQPEASSLFGQFLPQH